MGQASQVERDKAAGGGRLPSLTVATKESNPLVSFRVTLSPTHASTPCQSTSNRSKRSILLSQAG